MDEFFTRVWQNLIDRVGGPMAFRFILQPTMSAIFGIRDGLKDAQEGRPAYLWSIFTDPAHRREQLRDGWRSVAKIFGLGLLLDAIYQITVFHTFYPGEALIIASLLALVPYLLIRGPVNRIARRRHPGAASDRARP